VDLERLGLRPGGIKPFLSNSIVITLAALARKAKNGATRLSVNVFTVGSLEATGPLSDYRPREASGLRPAARIAQ